MNEFDEEGRKQRRNEKLGTNNHICLACSFSGDGFQFDWHHIAARPFDKKLQSRFCVRCHRDFTRQQWRLPKPSSKLPPPLECVAHLCIGLAIVIEPIANMVEDYGRRLIADARRRKRGNNSLHVEVGHYHGALTTFLRAVADALRNCGFKLLGNAPPEFDCNGSNAI